MKRPPGWNRTAACSATRVDLGGNSLEACLPLGRDSLMIALRQELRNRDVLNDCIAVMSPG